jgi:hypothetical protein
MPTPNHQITIFVQTFQRITIHLDVLWQLLRSCAHNRTLNAVSALKPNSQFQHFIYSEFHYTFCESTFAFCALYQVSSNTFPAVSM